MDALPAMKIYRQSSKKIGYLSLGRADISVDVRGDGVNMAVVPASTQKIPLAITFCVVKFSRVYQFVYNNCFQFRCFVPLVFLVVFSFGKH
jgi:hypothetical protein